MRLTRAAAAIACVVLIEAALFPGAPLTRIGTGFPAMVPPTAMGIVAIAAALEAARRGRQGLASAIASLTLVVALGVIVVGVGSGRAFLANGDRVALGTAFGLGLVSLAVAVHALRRMPPGARLSRCCAGLRPGTPACLALIVALLAITGFLLDSGPPGDFFLLTGMSLPTAVCLGLLALAVLLQDSDEGWLGFAVLRGAEGGGIRRAMLLAVLAPLGLAWALGFAMRAGWISGSLAQALMAEILVVIAVAAVSLMARNRRREAERNRAETRWLRELIESSGLAAMVFDSRGGLILANRQARDLSGSAGSAAEWLATATFHAPGTLERLTGAGHPLHLIAEADPRKRHYVCWFDPTGVERSLRFSARRVSAPGGGEDMTLLSIVDETESWSTRDQLTHIERLEAIGVIAGGAAHDFSNVLGTIQLNADVGMLAEDGPANAQFEAITEACERGFAMTERLRGLSRDNLGAPDTQDLCELVRDSSKLMSAALGESISLALRLPEEPLHVYLDRSDMEVALINLAINARRAIDARPGADPVFHLSLSQENESAVLVLRDEGCGMNKDQLSHATEPFFSAAPQGAGSGLGLSMVDAFVRRTAGTLSLDSRDGGGTTITIVLPLTDPDESADALHAGDLGHDLVGLRVLVVEDDPQFAEALPKALDALGAQVDCVTLAEQGLERLRSGERYDLLISDIRLPGAMNGVELADTARAESPDLPILLISGFGSPRLASDESLRYLLLRKPVRLRVLANAARIVLQRQSDGSGIA